MEDFCCGKSVAPVVPTADGSSVDVVVKGVCCVAPKGMDPRTDEVGC